MCTWEDLSPRFTKFESVNYTLNYSLLITPLPLYNIIIRIRIMIIRIRIIKTFINESAY